MDFSILGFATASRRRTGVGRMLRWPAGMFVVLLVIAAICAPLLTPYSPTEMESTEVLVAPSWGHPMGTDQFGRDILSRLLFGTRIVLSTGFGATLVAAVAGIPLGSWAGFKGGWVDALVMRGVDTVLAVPAVLLAMALVAVTGPGALNAGIAVAVVSFPQFARIARSGVLAQREFEYVHAAVAAGAGELRVVFRSIMPNVFSPILIQIPVAVSRAILLEAGLSFLGLGTQPPQASWGLMVSESREYMFTAPWYGIFPGLVITLTVIALNDIADRLRAVWRV
jgi:ABC-type dipeptide/oligopeptide/nickel transport system permease subunit